MIFGLSTTRPYFSTVDVKRWNTPRNFTGNGKVKLKKTTKAYGECRIKSCINKLYQPKILPCNLNIESSAIFKEDFNVEGLLESGENINLVLYIKERYLTIDRVRSIEKNLGGGRNVMF